MWHRGALPWSHPNGRVKSSAEEVRSVADPKVMVMAVIAALVILIVLLGTTAVFEHRSRPAGQEALSR
jgi:hypothetical protein